MWLVRLNAFTLLRYSGKCSIRLYSKKSAFIQDAECWQETWARHTSKCRGYPSHRSPITFMNDWIHGLMMTLVHDSHHGYIAQLWPTLWAPKELQWEFCFSLSLGGEPSLLLWVVLMWPLQQYSLAVVPSPLLRGSPASVDHGDIAEMGHSRTGGLGELSPSTSYYSEDQCGWVMPIYILLLVCFFSFLFFSFFPHLKTSLAETGLAQW